MGHSKQNKSANKKDGKHRVETREEKKQRLKEQAEAREACFKVVPYAVGVVVFLLILFGAWVKSVPPKAPKVKSAPAAGEGTSKTMNIDAEMLQRARDGDGNIQLTPEMLKEMGLDGIDSENIQIMSGDDAAKERAAAEASIEAQKEAEEAEEATTTDANEEHVEL